MDAKKTEPKTEPKTVPRVASPEDRGVKGLNYSLETITKKPTRRYRKGSKYDPLLEDFMKGSTDTVKVTIPDLDGNYIRTQLNKRLEATENDKVTVSVINGVCYLEKRIPSKKP